MILIGLYSGTRPGATLKLRWLPSTEGGWIDVERGFTHVIHFGGKPITSVHRSWQSVRLAAGSNQKDGPHILRHTAATWVMSWGLDPSLISGYLGMSIEVLMSVYAHHHPTFQADIAQATPKKHANRSRTK